MSEPQTASPPTATAKAAKASAGRDPKKKYIINIAIGNDQEDSHVFVGGGDSGDMRIKRGVDVTVPYEVLTRLDDAVIGVPQKKEGTNGGVDEIEFVERKRFPYTVVGVA